MGTGGDDERYKRKMGSILSLSASGTALERVPKHGEVSTNRDGKPKEAAGGSADHLHKHHLDAALAWWLRW